MTLDTLITQRQQASSNVDNLEAQLTKLKADHDQILQNLIANKGAVLAYENLIKIEQENLNTKSASAVIADEVAPAATE